MACRLLGAKLLSEPMVDYVNWILANIFQWKCNQNTTIVIDEHARENVVCEMVSILSRSQCVKIYLSNYLKYKPYHVIIGKYRQLPDYYIYKHFNITHCGIRNPQPHIMLMKNHFLLQWAIPVTFQLSDVM